MIILRIISFIVLFLGIVFLPWPVVAGLAAIFIAIFSWYWEAVFMGFLLGSVYGLEKSDASLLFVFFTFSLTTVLFAEEFFKNLIQGKNIISRAIVAFGGGCLLFLFWLIFKIFLYHA
jgi:hypothetical protein